MARYPEKDAWCEPTTCYVKIPREVITCQDGQWNAAAGEITFSSVAAVGTSSISVWGMKLYWIGLFFRLFEGKEFNSQSAYSLNFQVRLSEIGPGHFLGRVTVRLVDVNGKIVQRDTQVPLHGIWVPFALEVGKENEWKWGWVDAGFDWTKIKEIWFYFDMNGVGEGTAYVDDLHFILKVEYAILWITSEPVKGVSFNVDGSPGKTDTFLAEIPGTPITVTVEQTHEGYSFSHWEDGSTSPSRSFIIWTDMTITAHYTGGLPPPPPLPSPPRWTPGYFIRRIIEILRSFLTHF